MGRISVTSTWFLLILQSVLICSLMMGWFSSWQLEQPIEIWLTSGEKTPSWDRSKHRLTPKIRKNNKKEIAACSVWFCINSRRYEPLKVQFRDNLSIVYWAFFFFYRLTDTQFKIDALDKDPFALDNLARPLPFRGSYTHPLTLWKSVRRQELNLPWLLSSWKVVIRPVSPGAAWIWNQTFSLPPYVSRWTPCV